MNEDERTMFNSVITMGQNALKAILFVNTVFAIGVLLLLSKMVEIMFGLGVFTLKAIDVTQLAHCYGMFALGAGAAVVAFGASYVAQFLYAMNKHKYGYYVHAVVAILVILSYIEFILGSYGVFGAFIT